MGKLGLVLFTVAGLGLTAGGAMAFPAAGGVPAAAAASEATQGVDTVRWVCGPYRCFWRPNYYGYGFYRPFYRSYYGGYGYRRFGYGYGWRHRRWGW